LISPHPIDDPLLCSAPLRPPCSVSGCPRAPSQPRTARIAQSPGDQGSAGAVAVADAAPAGPGGPTSPCADAVAGPTRPRAPGTRAGGLVHEHSSIALRHCPRAPPRINRSPPAGSSPAPSTTLAAVSAASASGGAVVSLMPSCTQSRSPMAARAELAVGTLPPCETRCTSTGVLAHGSRLTLSHRSVHLMS
jgi:hypothetical protein